MKKAKNFIKRNTKVVIAFLLGGIIIGTGGVYAATVLSSSSVSYSNTSSKLISTNVQDAIDELVDKTDIRKSPNIVSAYTYNQTSGTSNYCVTGEEDTCVKTDCYKSITVNSCKAGDIIKYKVNDTDIITFHVMFDEGNTMTMQSQKNTIYNTVWETSGNNTQGPLNILSVLESVTAGWRNVNNQTYTMGTTVFKTNAYTGCSDNNSCTANSYLLEQRIAKARMITVQEAAVLGCTSQCPIWMYNYLFQSTSNGGTMDDTYTANEDVYNFGYWTMSADSSFSANAWRVHYRGSVGRYQYNRTDASTGARAVVVISK